MDEVIRAVLVDDEESSLIILKKLLADNCPNVEVVGTADSFGESIKRINKLKPDLVFLDISMPDGDGFEVLENISYKSFHVIFVTAYDEYALKAIEFSALHYLLKPIEVNDLVEAVGRFEKKQHDEKSFDERMKVLNDSLNDKHEKIVLPTQEGLIIIEIDEIMRLEASSNYTIFVMKNQRNIIVSKSMNNYEKILNDVHFSRVHHKHLVNLKYIKEYEKGRGGFVIMMDGSSVIVSERKREDFLRDLKSYAKYA